MKILILALASLVATPVLAQDPDCDDNGIPDAQDLLLGTHTDCNQNEVPDICDVLAPAGTVVSHASIVEGDLPLGATDRLGLGNAANLRGLGGEIWADVAAGTADTYGGKSRVYLLSLSPLGHVDQYLALDPTLPPLAGLIPSGAEFGRAVEWLGDVDGDGVGDLAVGAPRSNGNGTQTGSVWILFLNLDGTIKAYQEIGSGAGGMQGPIQGGDGFGNSITRLGDLDGDGSLEIAVGTPWSNDGGSWRGGLWILSLDSAGLVVGEQRISQTQGGLAATLPNGAILGVSSDCMGDLDGDGVQDLVASAKGEAHTGAVGRVLILFLNADGTVKSETVISPGLGGFTGSVGFSGYFGEAVSRVSDLDGDGVPEIAVGNPRNVSPSVSGTVWLLYLNVDGTVHSQAALAAGALGLDAAMTNNDRFGSGIVELNDLNGDGRNELMVGAFLTDGASQDSGALYTIHFAMQAPDSDGNGVIDSCDGVVSYCPNAANSTGAAAVLTFGGTPSIGANTFSLGVTDAVPNQFGMLFYGPTQNQTLYGNGMVCITQPYYRLQPAVLADAAGNVTRLLDFTQVPAGSGPGQIHPFSTWNFQYWYRDPFGAPASFNFSSALQVTFTP